VLEDEDASTTLLWYLLWAILKLKEEETQEEETNGETVHESQHNKKESSTEDKNNTDDKKAFTTSFLSNAPQEPQFRWQELGVGPVKILQTVGNAEKIRLVQDEKGKLLEEGYSVRSSLLLSMICNVI
jgi:hypothetical protein